jgi:hypothetical protein
MNPDLPNELGFLIVVGLILVMCVPMAIWAVVECVRVWWKRRK